MYWISGAILVPRLGAIGLPTAYAIASLSFIGYLAVYRRAVAKLSMGTSMLEFTALALLLAVAAGWWVGGGQMLGVAAVSTAMAALMLRRIPAVALVNVTDVSK